MSRIHDDGAEGAAGTHSIRPAAQRTSGDTTKASLLEQMQQTAGNAAVSRLLDPGVANRIEASLGGGRPLDRHEKAAGGSAATDEAMSARVHDDSASAELAASLRARAFTIGRDIFLGGGGVDPTTDDGRRTLSHELAHVAQAPAGQPPRARSISRRVDRAEREAASRASRTTAAAGARSHETVESGMVHRLPVATDDEQKEILATAPVPAAPNVGTESVGPTAAGTALPDTPGSAPVPTSAGATPAAGGQPAGTPAAANPALMALFDVTVIGKIANAQAALKEQPIDAARAYASMGEASEAVEALAFSYRTSDPLLWEGLIAIFNNMVAVRAALGPKVGKAFSDARIAENVDTAMDGVTAARSKLH